MRLEGRTEYRRTRVELADQVLETSRVAKHRPVVGDADVRVIGGSEMCFEKQQRTERWGANGSWKSASLAPQREQVKQPKMDSWASAHEPSCELQSSGGRRGL
jgi:phosphate-selective porin